MRFGYFGKDGRIVRAHNEEIVNELPREAVELTAEQWENRFDLQLINGKLSVNPHQDSDEVIAAPPKPVPQSVSRAQGKAALIQAGLWSQVLAFVDSIPDATQQALAEVALNDTTEWRRDSPFLTAAADAIGLDSEGLDSLFMTASEIVL